MDAVVIVVLAALLLGTILVNAGVRSGLTNALASSGLLPRWTFFAPTPGTQNLYLLYRDVYSESSVGPWHVLHQMDQWRTPWTFIWNPRKRLRKALHDVMTDLPFTQLPERPELFKLSTPYLLILNHVSRMPRLGDPLATQFMIVEDSAGEPPRMLFCSEMHGL